MDRLALLMVTIAFQLHAVCMATTGKYSTTSDPERDDAIKAFIILAFIFYLGAFILCVLINYGDLAHKVAKIVMTVCAILGGKLFG